MRSRLELSQILNAIPGVEHVYYQPSANIKLKYPCIKYEMDRMDSDYADDLMYRGMKRYTITVIDSDPDSTIYEHILKLRYSSFDRVYAADQLYHYVCTLYF